MNGRTETRRPLRLFRPGGTTKKRLTIRRVDSAGIEVSRFKVSRQEHAYMQAMGMLR